MQWVFDNWSLLTTIALAVSTALAMLNRQKWADGLTTVVKGVNEFKAKNPEVWDGLGRAIRGHATAAGTKESLDKIVTKVVSDLPKVQ